MDEATRKKLTRVHQQFTMEPSQAKQDASKLTTEEMGQKYIEVCHDINIFKHALHERQVMVFWLFFLRVDGR